ncbi:MAG: hypothetical protein NVSMB18_23090 [Acetobacteraceae bacterium]
MRTYTAHLKPARMPVLVREGWSWGAALFGALWLVAHRAWIPAALHIAAVIVLPALVPAAFRLPLLLGIAALMGLLGRDMVRWSLERRGYVLAHVLAARDEDGALGRLLTARTDIAQQCAMQLG